MLIILSLPLIATGLAAFSLQSIRWHGWGISKLLKPSELDYLEGPDAFGFLETTSFSHKTRMTSNAQGFQLKLVSPIRGIGPGTWGTHFVQAAKDVRRPLTGIQHGEPLVPALDVNGEFQSRPMKSSHLVRWVRGILRSDTFTGHSAKATVLSWLAKWGGPPDDRRIARAWLLIVATFRLVH